MMTDIPKQLQDKKFRFVKLRPLQKRAFEIGWQKDKNYTFDDPSLVEHINKGGNYGVFCGNGGLLVVDADTPEMVEIANSKLPQTFTIKTKKGYHYYYDVGNIKTKKMPLKYDNYHYGDFLGTGSYVVGCGSKVEHKLKVKNKEGVVHEHTIVHEYTIERDIPITKIDYGYLKSLLSDFFTEPPIKKDSITYKDKGIQDLDILDVVDTSGLKKRGDELQGPHPIHGSTGGMNFAVNPSKNTWHCYRCDSGGGPLSWIAVKEGIIDCSQAKPGGLRGDDFLKALKIAINKYGLKVSALTPKTDMAIPSDTSIESFSNLVLIRLLVKDKDGATELLVNRIKENNHIYTIKDDEKDEIWIYKDGIYVPQGKTTIKEICREILGKAYTEPLANRVIAKIETDTYIEANDFFNNDSTEEVAVENGILNIFTKELSEFTPNKIFFNKLPIRYDPTKTCPNIKKHFMTVLKNPKSDTILMEELFGFLLLKDYKIEKAFMFVGDGRNGKSKTLMLIKAFLGDENVVDIPLQQFESDLYAQAELFKKMANISGDLDPTGLKSTGTFKKLVGRDLISAPRKFKTRVSFINYAKLIFATNQLPKTYDISPAFWHRWVLFDFPYKFVSEKEKKLLKGDELKNVKDMDPDIIKKLTTPDELSGLLNVALQRLDELLKRRDFSYSKSTEDVKNMWVRKSDSFSAFLMDCVVEDWDNSITKQDLRKAYANYCKKHKLKMAGDKNIKYTLTTNYGVSEERSSDEGRKMVWTGISFNDAGNYYLKYTNNLSRLSRLSMVSNTVGNTKMFNCIESTPVDIHDTLDTPQDVVVSTNKEKDNITNVTNVTSSIDVTNVTKDAAKAFIYTNLLVENLSFEKLWLKYQQDDRMPQLSEQVFRDIFQAMLQQGEIAEVKPNQFRSVRK